MTETQLLLTNARIPGSGDVRDILLTNGLIAAVRAPGELADASGEAIDLAGRWVAPGLWDSHVHFRQWTLVRRRLDVSSATSAADAARLVRERLAQPGPAVVELEGYGFRDGLWADEPTRQLLDEVAPTIPVILVSGDLHCAWLNSVAIASLGLPDSTPALLREGAWIEVNHRRERAAQELPVEEFRDAAVAAAARGVVGIVDFEYEDTIGLWRERVAQGVDMLRVDAAVWPSYLEVAVVGNRHTGDIVEGSDGLVRVGPLKIVTDGSLNTRTAYCFEPYPGLEGTAHGCGVLSVPRDELDRLVHRAVETGFELAIHAIGDHANSIVLDAYEAAGARGSVEHAQLVAEEDFIRFGRLGLTASIQPEHAMDDRDVADRHWAGRTDRAFAFRSLLDAGAQLALGSDAPVAPLDPWHAIAAAVSRSRGGREPWHPLESLPVGVALAASSRGRSGVATGTPADLVVTDADPLVVDNASLRDMPVAATLLGGRFTHNEL